MANMAHFLNRIIIRSIVLAFLIAVGSGAQARGSESSAGTAGPLPDARVLFIFVDSLRPDTVDEMVAEGRLPTIKKLFYDEGLRFKNFFTTFPSLTVNATGILMTGKWANETGLKAQSFFERYPVRKRSVWKKIFFVKDRHPKYINLLADIDGASRILKQNETKAIYNYLGDKYHPSLVPINPSTTLVAWSHVAANNVKQPLFVTTEAAENLDMINARYALQYMVSDTRGRFFWVWFTDLDKGQHADSFGQHGDVRKKMEETDGWIGKIYEGLVRSAKGKPVYIFLFSDHGAYGGQGGVYNQPFYLGRDYFYRVLKMNVIGPDYMVRHPGTNLKSFAYIDNMGRGQARIFLPVADAFSGNWNRPNSLYELQHYGLGPNRQAVNLIDALLGINLEKRNEFPAQVDPHPVEFVFAKVSPTLIYVKKQGGSEALIEVERRGEKDWYRYEPVRNVTQDREGKLSFDRKAKDDPFGYLSDPRFHAANPREFIAQYHDDAAWLRAAHETDFPNAVTVLVKMFTWKSELSYLAPAQDPDLCLSAMRGWNFRVENIKGADHGSITRDAMQAVLMLSGPNIRKGVDLTPYQIVDVTPTLFHLLGFDGETDFSSVPIEGIYET